MEHVAVDRLSDEERLQLEVCEKIVADPAVAQGAALRVIRDRRLYRDTHETFQQYCLDRWQMSKTQANRLIDAAEVLRNLTPIGVTELCESQARELAALKLPSGAMDAASQRLVWQVVRATAPTDDRGRPVPTAAHVKSLATVVKTLIDSDAIDDGTGEMVPWNGLSSERRQALLRANLAEETYERHQRHTAHRERIQQPSWAVVVLCADAVDQERVATRLEAEGRTVRRTGPRKPAA